MKVGLFVASPNIKSKIKTSYNADYELSKSDTTVVKLVVFDPLEHELFRDFDYSENDWMLVFEEYKSFPSIDFIPSIFVRAIIRLDSKFNPREFAKAIEKQCNMLPPDVTHKFLDDIWRLSFYSAKIYHKEIVAILSAYDSKYHYKSEKGIITEAIKFCEDVTKSRNRFQQNIPSFESKDIFGKIFLMDRIISKAREYYHTDNELIRLLFWKNGLLSSFDWGTLMAFFYCFTPIEQLNIVRKIAYDIRTSELQITIADLIKLIEANPEINAIHERMAVSKVNKFLELLVHSLDVYSRTGKFLTQGKVFDILTDIKNTRSKVFLGEKLIFDFCNGGVLNDNKYNPDQEISKNNKYFFNRSLFFRNAPRDKWAGMEECLKDVCNGRISLEKDQKVNKDFLWCYGKRCYQNTIRKRDDYKKYKFVDFCSAFDMEVTQEKEYGLVANDEYSKFLDTIGKISRISANLYCESCGFLLFPIKRSDKEFINYYNSFHCQNGECNQHGVRIYLSHCHTFNCRGVIDSRLHKKCPNGMHICPECFGCCSDRFYQKQKAFRLRSGLPVPTMLESQLANKAGHNDKEIFYCYKCGNKLTDNKCNSCDIEHKDVKRYKYE